jgi:hypothetical protein
MAAVSNSRLFVEGGAAGFVAGSVSTVGWLAASNYGIPMLVEVPNLGLEPVGWVRILLLSVLAGLGAALVALLTDGRKGARRTFTIVAGAVLVLSLAPLVTQPDAVPLSTRLVLALMHVVAYVAVVPRLAGRLRAR